MPPLVYVLRKTKQTKLKEEEEEEVEEQKRKDNFVSLFVLLLAGYLQAIIASQHVPMIDRL